MGEAEAGRVRSRVGRWMVNEVALAVVILAITVVQDPLSQLKRGLGLLGDEKGREERSGARSRTGFEHAVVAGVARCWARLGPTTRAWA